MFQPLVLSSASEVIRKERQAQMNIIGSPFIFRRIERISGLFVCIGYNVYLCLSTSEIIVLGGRHILRICLLEFLFT